MPPTVDAPDSPDAGSGPDRVCPYCRGVYTDARTFSAHVYEAHFNALHRDYGVAREKEPPGKLRAALAGLNRVRRLSAQEARERYVEYALRADLLSGLYYSPGGALLTEKQDTELAPARSFKGSGRVD